MVITEHLTQLLRNLFKFLLANKQEPDIIYICLNITVFFFNHRERNTYYSIKQTPFILTLRITTRQIGEAI